MNKTMKIVSILLMSIVLLMGLSTGVMAINAGDIASGLTGTTSTAQGSITTIGNQIIGVITTVAVVVAVVVILILGIKYMVGSASEKAEYKKTMIPYLVGAVLIFSASAIVNVVISMSTMVTTV